MLKLDMDLVSYKNFFLMFVHWIKSVRFESSLNCFCVSFNRNVIYQDRQSQLFWLALALTSKYNKELVQFM